MEHFFHNRSSIEKNEKRFLAPFATHSAESRGREYSESEDDQRTIFQRDRDRVIHCRAYRRLKGKTQVFVAHHGDHFRNRLTHTMEVAQLSRDIARNLAVNEDLAETIALAHDLGHTPFGHAGQEAMMAIMSEFGEKFEHNEQSRRIVQILEKKSAHFPGLNLSWEVRDGMQKHRKADYESGVDISQNGSLEAQIVDLSDEISYLTHDLDDGLRGGILLSDELSKIDIWKEVLGRVPHDSSEKIWISEVISELMKTMTNDLFAESIRRLDRLSPASSLDIRNADFPIIAFSKDLEHKLESLRHFLYHQMYMHPEVALQSARGKKIIEKIFRFLLEFPKAIPSPFREMLADGEKVHFVIKDFIAGMTDDFALDFARKIEAV